MGYNDSVVVAMCMACRSTHVAVLSQGPSRCLDCGSYRVSFVEQHVPKADRKAKP